MHASSSKAARTSETRGHSGGRAALAPVGPAAEEPERAAQVVERPQRGEHERVPDVAERDEAEREPEERVIIAPASEASRAPRGRAYPPLSR